MVRQLRSSRVARLLAREDGFSLIEMLTVIVLLGIILTPLIVSLVQALDAQASQTNVVIAQEQARLALERMRKDIHCAHAAGPASPNDSGGYTMILTETNVTGTAECPGLLAVNASAVQWCTVPVDDSGDRYRLYREDDANLECDGTQSTFQVDYVATANVWPTPPSCAGGEYPTVDVDIPVDVSPGTTMSAAYTLQDQIALRNATPCS